MDKCEECLRSRLIVSENGYHAACCLPQKKAIACITGEKDLFISLKKCDDETVRKLLDSEV